MKVIAFFLVLVLSSCSFLNKKDRIIPDRYAEIIKGYDCHDLDLEATYITQHLNSLKEQQENNFFEKALESILSIGIFTFSAHYNLKKSIKIFEKKLKITNTNQKLNHCL